MADPNRLQSLLVVTVVAAIGVAVSIAGSDGGDRWAGVPVFALCGALAFGINWLAYIPSAIARTEHYYDLVGGISYVCATIAAVVLSGELDLRATLVASMVLIWSLRLSTFLFKRISRSGGDSRFDDIKGRPVRFLMAWTLQGLWVLLTAAAAFAVITGGTRVPLGIVGVLGIAVWIIGMSIEIVADHQKSKFKADPDNEGDFIDVGLWAWSRHPNYFGEIVLWIGVALVALPVLTGWQYVTLISPVFVATLLIKGSGIPPLEKKADERWGGQDDYEHYKRTTPVLILRPPAVQSQG